MDLKIPANEKRQTPDSFTKPSLWRRLLNYRRYIVIIVVQVVLLPILIIYETKASKCGYVLLVMAVFWMTEALPIAVTSLLPLVLFPLFGIMTSNDVSMQYMKPTNVLLFGGILVALAMENCLLHKRLALRVLQLVGTHPCWLLAGFMLPSWFLSQWISNTATAAMMVPVAVAVIDQSDMFASRDASSMEDVESGDYSKCDGSESSEMRTKDAPTEIELSEVDKQKEMLDSDINEESSGSDHMHGRKPESNETEISGNDARSSLTQFSSALLQSVAYSCFIGGTASLTGTPSNVIMKGVADSIYDKHGLETPVTFTSWLAIGYPISSIMIVVAWLWLQVVFLGWRGSLIGYFKKNKKGEKSERSQRITATINKEYEKLGSIKFSEVATIISFVLLITVWFFRKPGFFEGWDRFFLKGYISSAVPAVAFGILMFIIPSRNCCSKDADGKAPKPLLTWDVVHRKMPWGVLLLMGGGLALAEGIVISGLSALIGDSLRVFGGLPGWLLVLCLSVIVAFITDFVSNPATATVLTPIAERLGMNPLYLMFPVAFASSLAFSLPVASPPAAIVFSTGRIKILNMVKAGVLLNVWCSGVITLAVHTWGDAIFQFHVIHWNRFFNTTTDSSVL